MRKSSVFLSFLFILFSHLLYASTLADDFKRFENTVNIAIRRIEFVLDSDVVDASEMRELIIRQLDLAAIANDCISQNEEDFFNLALYLVSTRFRQFDLALKALTHEQRQASYPPLKRWLKSRVLMLNNDKIKEFDIASELADLINILNIK